MISRILLLLLPIVNSQIIDITVCADNLCNDNCINWQINSGDCAICQGGVCSASNPSSITTTNYISLYSDNKCNNLIPGAYKMSISLDNQCSRFPLGGSYRAKNVSAIIGASFVGVFIVILCIVCILRCCGVKCCCGNRQEQIPNSNAVIITDQNNPQVVDYFSKNENLPTYGYPVFTPNVQHGQQSYQISHPYVLPQSQAYPQNIPYDPSVQSYVQYNNNNQNNYQQATSYYPQQNAFPSPTYYPQYATAPAPSAPYSSSYNQEPKVI